MSYSITKNTAGRIKQYCEAIEAGYEKQFSKNPYSFIELGKGTIEEKLERWKEVKFITGKDEPLRTELRYYRRHYKDYGTTHDERMEKILQLKILQLELKREEA